METLQSQHKVPPLWRGAPPRNLFGGSATDRGPNLKAKKNVFKKSQSRRSVKFKSQGSHDSNDGSSVFDREIPKEETYESVSFRPLSRKQQFRVATPGNRNPKLDLMLPMPSIRNKNPFLSGFAVKQNMYSSRILKAIDEHAVTSMVKSHSKAELENWKSSASQQQDSEKHRKQFESSFNEIQNHLDELSGVAEKKRLSDWQEQLREMQQKEREVQMQRDSARHEAISPRSPNADMRSDNITPLERFERRSVRQLRSDVQMKLDILLRDSEKSSELLQRLEEYKAEQKYMKRSQPGVHKIKNFVELNVTTPREREPDTYREMLHKRAREGEKKRQEVRRRAIELQMEKSRKAVESSQRRERRLKEAAIAEAEAALEAKKEETSEKWVPFVAFSSRQSVFLDILRKHREENTNKSRLEQSVMLIQNWYRKHYYQYESQRFETCRQIVLRALTRYTGRWKIWKKIRDASVVHEFLKDVRDVNKIVKVVKKYRLCVAMVQRFLRAHMPVTHMQLERLSSHWLKIESQILDERNKKLKKRHEKEVLRQKALKNRLVSVAATKKEQKKEERKEKLKEMSGKFAMVIPNVPEEIRMKTLIKDLKQRKLLYLEEVNAYRDSLDDLEKKHDLDVVRDLIGGKEENDQSTSESSAHSDGEAEETQENSAPVKPHFHWAVSDEYMKTMVDNAIRNVMESMQESKAKVKPSAN